MKKKIMAMASAAMLAVSMFGTTASAATYLDYDTFGVYRDSGASDYKTTDQMYLKGYKGNYTFGVLRMSSSGGATRCIVRIQDAGRTVATFSKVATAKYGGDGQNTIFTSVLDADGSYANVYGEGYIYK